MLPSRRTVLSALSLATLGAAVACRQEPDPESDGEVWVSGVFGMMPRVDFETPLSISAPYTEEIITGEGTELRDAAAVMLSYLAIDAVTGETIRENYQESPEIMVLGEDAGVLHAELLGRTEGSRLLRVELGTRERPNPTVLVYDIRHTTAWGEPVPAPKNDDQTPQVGTDDDGIPVVQVPDADPPADLQVVPVLRGDGPQVRDGQAVTVRYSTYSWSTGEITDTLWGEGMLPTTIPFTGLIPAWQNGLVDEQVGSRLILVTPPELAFGTEALVFLIDVLAVSAMEENGEDAEDSENGGEDGGNEEEDTG
ncbi:FKBP-type peptidyl-prolyl cis-trans isomerase [Pseudactinotalea sp. Z1739]|uniref:FKBP-type peptidyl-prolyl cis-trans isomerase n=1 Tax=Pseudactinotalea sp. Z1739 TaxID=3413028 RepID=UPI003C7E0238